MSNILYHLTEVNENYPHRDPKGRRWGAIFIIVASLALWLGIMRVMGLV